MTFTQWLILILIGAVITKIVVNVVGKRRVITEPDEGSVKELLGEDHEVFFLAIDVLKGLSRKHNTAIHLEIDYTLESTKEGSEND